ncbi:MAG: response regulator transcription factor [Chloroflexia bacterium]|nr:response regulator transcription factor [Chloroflexia bacterium]
MRVLVIEDDVLLGDAVGRGMRQAGFAVDVTWNGMDGLEHVAVIDYDVVVLDRNLPDIHGDEVCRSIAEKKLPPRVLMLTAEGSIQARVDGLAVGADDYLPKPFAMVELIARIRALARRPSRATPSVIEIGDMTIDNSAHRVTRSGRELSLTPKEFGVLATFAATPGEVVSAEHLLEAVWDELADPFTNAVRITMMTLRRKLGEPPLIETIVGVGYRLIES